MPQGGVFRLVRVCKRGPLASRVFLHVSCRYSQVISGGYGSGVPPLPIPHREVKPGRADGTAQPAGE